MFSLSKQKKKEDVGNSEELPEAVENDLSKLNAETLQVRHDVFCFLLQNIKHFVFKLLNH